MNTSRDILLIVVNFNQVKEISSFLEKLKLFWSQEHCIVVDDGSTDGSQLIPQELGFRLIQHKVNSGVGAAIRTGILYAKENGYLSVLIMSSNGKMLPEEIQTLVAPVRDGTADYVTGSRFVKGGESPGLGAFRLISIPIFSILSSILLAKKFTDITCGFRCYRIDFLFQEHCDITQDWLSRYELEYYIHYWACHLGLRIKEVPVTIKYAHLEKKRTSKIRPIVDWWSMLRPLFYLRLGIRR